MPIDKTTKKRTMFQYKSKYSNPDWADADKKFAYRWCKVDSDYIGSDGIDSRGWEKAAIPAGQPGAGEFLRRGEHVLCKMPAEQNEAIKQEKLELARLNATRETETQKETMDRIGHEVRNKGGKIKFEYEVGDGIK